MKSLATLLLLIPFTLQAQQAFVAGGGSDKNETGSFSYSLGQIDYMSSNTKNGVALAGVQQPLSYEDYDIQKTCDGVQITISPNPTPNILNVYLNDDFVTYHYELSNVRAQIITTGKLTDGDTQIDLTSLAEGVYFLKVYNSDESDFALFKVVKKR